MKNKNVAGILALFLGSLGVHRFYLGQGGLGVLYLLMTIFGATALGAPTAAIIALIDAVIFFSMDKRKFDEKYNKGKEGTGRRERRANRREKRRDRWEEPERRYKPTRRENRRPTAAPNPPRRVMKDNPFRKKGIEAFKDYDYEEAVTLFTKALEINEQDVPVHFNLACSHSLLENKDKALYHLDRAVRYGFKDFEKIQAHDALAFLRVQPEFGTFKDNGYQLGATGRPSSSSSEERLDLEPTDQVQKRLRQLEEFRTKGLLSEEQFQLEKEKLLRG